MARASFWQQLKTLLKRNLLLKRRNRQQTIQELFMPVYFIAILALIRGLTTPKVQPMITDTKIYQLNDTRFDINTSKILYITPDSAAFQNVADQLAQKLGLTSSPAYKLFAKPEAAEQSYKTHHSEVLAGIDFAGTSLQDRNYTLRLPSESIVSTRNDYTGLGSCLADDGLENSRGGCPANTYLFTPFTHIQLLLDTLLIQMSASSTQNASMPQLSVQMLPRPEFKPNTIVLQIMSSIYFVLAYSPFIAFLSVNLVTEKQKKIKEAMRMMGMRDSAFWSSWGLVYAGVILIVTLIVTLLSWAIKLFENSNFFIFFLMLMLYGLSMVNLAFAITPFFSKAETAGAAASLSTILLSLLYFVVFFTRDVTTGQPTIPAWGLHLLCLISPLALSLAINEAVVLDITSEGMNFTTITHGIFPLRNMLIMLAVDVVLYGLLAFYLDNVIPNEYGTRRPAWFFLMPSYWKPPKARTAEELHLTRTGGDLDQGAAVTVDTNNMEAIPPDFKHKNVLRIFDIRKTFKADGKDVHAVQGISLDIYEGQITALLGHNGAGKTTLIHMLTGMTPATSGSATIYGLDASISSELTEIRTMIGLCPQHNILFDDLTPREHLDFYANLKGVRKENLDAEISKALRNVDMLDQGNTMSKQLSGGQKRKLCVAIALIGDPKVVFLDEPTAGMDPSSRRHLWRLLRTQQKDKLIVLTTHFMDEADILADRKAIISKGKLQCVGSSLFLKNRFGIGYHLSMVLEPSAEVEAITNLVKQNVHDAEEQRHHGKELTYTLPIASVSSFPKLFGSLEEKVDGETEKSSKLGIRTYGVSMTTLEEVFLKLGEEAEAEEEEAKNAADSRTHLNRDQGHTNYATSVTMQNGDDTSPSVDFRPVTPGEQQLVTGKALNTQRIKALMKIRALLLWRIPQRFFFQVIFPLVYILAGCAMLRFIPVPTVPNPTTKLLNSLYMRRMLFNSTGTGAAVDSFRQKLEAQNINLTSFQNVSTLLSANPPYFVGLQVKDITNSTQVINSDMTVLYNHTAVHAIPSTVNALTSAFLKMVANAQAVISTYSKPWPWITIQTAGFNGAIFGSSIFIGLALASIPGGLGVNIVKERTSKVKSQLRLAGVKMNMYWGTVFAFDAIQFYLSCLVAIIMLIAFQIPSMTTGGAILCIMLMFIGYVPANLFTSYSFGYAFDKFETAQSSLGQLFTWSSLIPFLIMSVVDMTSNAAVASGLHYAFCILIPTYPVMGCFYFIDKLYQSALATQGSNPTLYVSDYMAPDANIAITIFIPIVHCVVLYFVARILEVRSTGGNWRECARCGERAGSAVVPEANDDTPADEDEDVAAERRRVNEAQNSSNRKHVIGVKNLRKEFQREQKTGCCDCKKKTQSEKIRVAVRNSSFLVEPGEVLGLLGPNGAGKTTTLNMIISETAPTCGKVDVAGHNIQSNLSDAFQAMGHCPQHDPVWEYLYLREHIECYAAVRGVPPATIKAVCNYYMESLEIKEHADKKAKSLSGGTKRKLSYIVSMLGDPRVVLLDEPSTGMDPKSKRFLWDTISAAFNNDRRGAILTTHYMDEADALCSRVAIMVNGEMECIGSTQHLKDKFGGGYHLEVKLQGSSTEDQAAANMETLHTYVDQAFPGSVRMESFGDRAQYRIPHAHITSLSQTFLKLEEAKTLLSVEEYSFSQSTLEQVFLQFAKNQVEEGDSDTQPEPVSTARTRSLHRQLSMGSNHSSVNA